MSRWTPVRVLGRGLWFVAVLCAAVFALFLFLYRTLPAVPAVSVSAPRMPGRSPVVAIEDSAWGVFRRTQGQPAVSTGPFGKRFRLAGTFFAFGNSLGSSGSVCKAILDDLRSKEQLLVGEGEVLDGHEVVRILRDHLVVRAGSQEEEIWLSFADAGDAKSGGPTGPANQEGQGTPPLEVNRFGKRVGETRWVLNRDALMAYYAELREDPERIANLYTSLRPDYRNGSVAGYTLNAVGEKEFFDAAGLQEGDTVRSVNSMSMTSQSKAEYFIGEFMKERLSAVVLDVDRGGEQQKLVYLIR